MLRSKRLAVLAAVACTVPMALAVAPANAVPANDAAELCRALDEAGALEQFSPGATRGDCVNLYKGPSSENANNFIAGACGLDFVQALFDTSNKGQCIKAAKAAAEAV